MIETITLKLPLTVIKFEVDYEIAVLAINEMPLPFSVYSKWESLILSLDGDILQAYLRIISSFINDAFSVYDLMLEKLDKVIVNWHKAYKDVFLPLDGSKGIKLIEFSKSKTPIMTFEYIYQK